MQKRYGHIVVICSNIIGLTLTTIFNFVTKKIEAGISSVLISLVIGEIFALIWIWAPHVVTQIKLNLL